MENSFYFYIILALIGSFIVAAIPYFYKKKTKTGLNNILFLLRFGAVFLLLLLIINPKIKQETLSTIKPTLVIVTDDSKSIKNVQKDSEVSTLLYQLKQSNKLNEKFDIDYYTFSENISLEDTLNFSKNNTNIYQSLQSIDKMYKKKNAPIILITDGNQTVGNAYTSLQLHQDIYPIIIGDTTRYQDIKIAQLNTNKYAYLKNKFPVELFVNYFGKNKIASKLTVFDGKTTVFSKNIELTKQNNSKKIEFYIKAATIGNHNYKAYLSAIANEKNIKNNTRNFSVEVIDEQSKILIVSDILHPDIAMFKRSIENNKQRKVFVLKPDEVDKLSQYQLVIIYQPTPKFNDFFSKFNKETSNFMIVSGTQTDWSYLNKIQPYFTKKAITSTEDYLANYNTDYTTFITKDLGFDNFQPLTDYFGKVSFKVPYQSILHQRIGSISSEAPLLATFNDDSRRGAVLFGENIWRWRMSSKIEENTFQPFDDFINTLTQYLSSNKRTRFLEVSNKSIYYENETIKITAKYYDANYVFNPNAKLWIRLTHKQSKRKIEYPFALHNNYYEAQISDIQNGDYSFVVFDASHKNKIHRSFTVLNYNIEEQFTNANKIDLELLALNNHGKLFYTKTVTTLINDLMTNNDYVPIQRSRDIVSSLIDWKWLLALIALLLSLEWFIRKYKGYV